MDANVKEILEKYIVLIEKDEWDEFFETIQNEWIPQTICKVAQTLERSGIFPILYMTFIPEGYFILSGMEEYTTPDNVTRICYKSFYAADIESIHITGNVFDIGQYAFESCDFLTTVIMDEGVKYISDGAFYSCDELTSVILPRSLTDLGHNIFNSCDNLTELTYNGTISEWHKIRNREFINEGSYINKINCLDGTIEL